MIGIIIRGKQLTEVWAASRESAMGGKSSVRDSGDRAQTLLFDQFIGHLGNMALSIYQTGMGAMFLESRVWAARARREDRTAGDDGKDLPGAALDIKTSFMRAGRLHSKYRLAVRPAERHPNHIYYLALVEDPAWYKLKFREAMAANVVLMGWASDSMLPPEPDGFGSAFTGAYTLGSGLLLPLPPVVWDGVEYFKPGHSAGGYSCQAAA